MTNLPQPRSIELDLRTTPIIRKAVESLVLFNIDIEPTENALALAQGVSPYTPIINPHE